MAAPGNVRPDRTVQGIPTKDLRTTFAGRQDNTTWAKRNQSAGSRCSRRPRFSPSPRRCHRCFILTIEASGSSVRNRVHGFEQFQPCVAFRARRVRVVHAPADGTYPTQRVHLPPPERRVRSYNACTRGGTGWPRRLVGCGARGVRLSKQNGARAPLKTCAGRPTRRKPRQAAPYCSTLNAV